jgi:hypothetical protein
MERCEYGEGSMLISTNVYASERPIQQTTYHDQSTTTNTDRTDTFRNTCHMYGYMYVAVVVGGVVGGVAGRVVGGPLVAVQ